MTKTDSRLLTPEQIARFADRYLRFSSNYTKLLLDHAAAQEERIQALTKENEAIGLRMVDLVFEIDRLKYANPQIAALTAERDALLGKPEAVHQGALAAISALRQFSVVTAERDRMAEDREYQTNAHQAASLRIAELEAERDQLADALKQRVSTALSHALENTKEVRQRLNDSESGPNCNGCGRDLVYCNCNSLGPAQRIAALEKQLTEAFARLPVERAATDRAEAKYRAQNQIVARIWELFGTPSFEDLKGRSIYDLITDVQKRAERAEKQLARIPELLRERAAYKAYDAKLNAGNEIAAECAGASNALYNVANEIEVLAALSATPPAQQEGE